LTSSYRPYPNVVDGALVGVELRILPAGHQKGVADGVRVFGVDHVDGARDRGLAAAIGADGASVGNRDVAEALGITRPGG
jgi:hypothetical protein